MDLRQGRWPNPKVTVLLSACTAGSSVQTSPSPIGTTAREAPLPTPHRRDHAHAFGPSSPVPTLGRVIASVRVARQADPVAFAFGSVWVGHYGEGVVERIDPATDRPSRSA